MWCRLHLRSQRAYGSRELSFLFNKDQSFTSRLESCDTAFNLERMLLQRADFTSEEIALAISKLGELNSTNRPVIRRLLSLAESPSLLNTPSEVSLALHGIAKGRLTDRIPNALTNKLLLALESTSPLTSEEMAKSLWSFAELRQCDAGISRAFALKLEKRENFSDFSPVALRDAIWGLAVGSSHAGNSNSSGKLTELFAREVERQGISLLTARDLTRYAWSFAKLGHKQPRIYSLICRAVLDECKWKDFGEEDLVDLAWSLARAEYKHPVLFDAMADELLQRARFSPEQLASLVWSFAKLGFDSPKLFARVGEEMRASPAPLSFSCSHSIAQTVWAFAKMNHCDERLFALLSQQIQRGLTAVVWSSSDIADVCWSFAKCQQRDAALFLHLSRTVILPQVRELNFTPRQSSVVLWSFAELGFDDGDLFTALLGGDPERNLQAFSAQDLTKLAWAYAATNMPALDVVLSAVAKQFMERELLLRELTLVDFPMLAWSFDQAEAVVNLEAMLDLLAEEFVRRSSSNSTAGGGGMQWSCDALVDLARAFAHHHHALAHGKPALECIARKVMERCVNHKLELSTECIADLLEAFAQAKLEHDALGDFVSKCLLERNLVWETLPAHQVCTLLSSLAVVGSSGDRESTEVWKRAREGLSTGSFKRFTLEEKISLLSSFASSSSSHAAQQQQQLAPQGLAEEVMQDMLAAAGGFHDVRFVLLASAVYALSIVKVPHNALSVEWLASLRAHVAALEHDGTAAWFPDLARMAHGLHSLGVQREDAVYAWLVREMKACCCGLGDGTQIRDLIRAHSALAPSKDIAFLEQELLSRDAAQFSASDMLQLLPRQRRQTQQQPTRGYAPLMAKFEASLIANNGLRCGEFTQSEGIALLTAFAQDDKPEQQQQPRHKALFQAMGDHLALVLEEGVVEPRELVALLQSFHRTGNHTHIVLFSRIAKLLSSNRLGALSNREQWDVLTCFSGFVWGGGDKTHVKDLIGNLANELVFAKPVASSASSRTIFAGGGGRHIPATTSRSPAVSSASQGVELMSVLSKFGLGTTHSAFAKLKDEIKLQTLTVSDLSKLLRVLAEENSSNNKGGNQPADLSLLAALAEATSRPMQTYSARDVVQISRAMQNAGELDMASRFCHAYFQGKNFADMSTLDIGYVLNSLVKLGHASMELVSSVEDELCARSLTELSVHNMLTMLANLRKVENYQAPKLYAHILQELEARPIAAFSALELQRLNKTYYKDAARDKNIARFHRAVLHQLKLISSKA